MNINNFINLIEKTVMNDSADIIEHITTQFDSEQDAESDEKNIEQSKIKMFETYTAVQLLQLWEKQQKNEDSSILSFLNKYEQ